MQRVPSLSAVGCRDGADSLGRRIGFVGTDHAASFAVRYAVREPLAPSIQPFGLLLLASAFPAIPPGGATALRSECSQNQESRLCSFRDRSTCFASFVFPPTYRRPLFCRVDSASLQENTHPPPHPYRICSIAPQLVGF